MAKPRIRIKLPKKASKGEIVEVKSLITHKMESGQRKDKKGKLIPRKIINKFSCKYNGKEVFGCDFAPAVSANPFLVFHIRATASGPVEFSWTDDDGSVYSKTLKLSVA